MTTVIGAYNAVDMVVWSGTGNTLHVAKRIAEAARAQGAVAHVHSSTSAVEHRPTAKRLLGFLAPTHGFTAPWPLIKARRAEYARGTVPKRRYA